jgi:DNA-binding GntR family transcriptional regulator
MEAQLIREALEAVVVRRMAEAPTPEFLAFGVAALERQRVAAEGQDRDLFLELDEAFHKAICDGAGLKRSWRVIQSVKFQMDRVRYLSLPVPGQLTLILGQHTKIFEAIRSKNPDRAERVMRLHLKEVFKSIEYLIEQKPSLFV